MRFVVKPSDDGQQWYFVVVASNGETLCTSETYREQRDARGAIDLIKLGAERAGVVVQPREKP